MAIEKHCNGPPTVAQNVLFFEKFIHSNGVRAQRQAMPMTYQEILVLWSTHINPPSLDSASLGTAVQNELKKMQPQLTQGTYWMRNKDTGLGEKKFCEMRRSKSSFF